ncbi:MAG: sigma 54-interacting transcriptional regulator [Desulfobacteraceae bacterium]|nr:sigma 54-interacting transcriptional regulator [Desulfobacteraceae bacterium]
MIDPKEFFHQGTLTICSTLDEDKMLDDCFRFLKNYIPLNGLMIGVYHTDSGSVEVISYTSEINLSFKAQELKLSKSDIEYVESTIGSVLLLQKLEDNPVGIRMKKAFNLPELSSVVLRLKVEDQRIGAIIAFAEGNKKFTWDHGKILSILHDPFAIAISNILRFKELSRLKDLLKDENIYLHEELRKIQGNIVIGQNSGLKEVMEMVSQVAPLESKVLILGETGVGKELIASSIHYNSKRRNKPFIRVNCGAIPESLIDSELFGHEKGSFTGALTAKKGKFERADNGTIFLDEIGELPLHVQTRLLRVLQTGEYERVGGTQTLKADVRIIAATNRNLEDLVHKGLFREDLWYRLNVFPIFIPPLRQRKNDIPVLTDYFIKKKLKELNLRLNPSVSEKGFSRLVHYSWPGNVRELENAVERELIKAQAKKSEILNFNEYENNKNSPEKSKDLNNESSDELYLSIEEVLKSHIEKVLEATKGKIQGENGAAKILDIHPSTLRHKMTKLKIEFGRKSK